MMRHGRRMMLLVLPRHHHRQTIHNSHHHPFVGAATALRGVPPTTLLISHRSCKHGSAIVCRLAGIGLVLRRARRRSMTLGSLQESHHMGFESIRLADRRRRLMLVLVRLGVRVVTLHGHRVPHARRDDVRQWFDCVSSVYFVTGDARHFVHHAENATLNKFRSLPLVVHYPIHCNPGWKLVETHALIANDKTATENRVNKTLFVLHLKTVDVARCCLNTVGWYHAIGSWITVS